MFIYILYHALSCLVFKSCHFAQQAQKQIINANKRGQETKSLDSGAKLQIKNYIKDMNWYDKSTYKYKGN